MRPGSALREKEEEKSASEASQAVIWGGGRLTKCRYMRLMPPIRPPTTSNNLSLKFQSERIARNIFEFARMK